MVDYLLDEMGANTLPDKSYVWKDIRERVSNEGSVASELSTILKL